MWHRLRGLKSTLSEILGQPGWLPRSFVVVGTLLSYVAMATAPWGVTLCYAVLWIGIYQVALGGSYNRGAAHAHQQMFEQVTGVKGDQMHETFEMYMNAKVVALHDLEAMGMKYGIPAEELQSIVDRGF